jgi:hypothetical protein
MEEYCNVRGAKLDRHTFSGCIISVLLEIIQNIKVWGKKSVNVQKCQVASIFPTL